MIDESCSVTHRRSVFGRTWFLVFTAQGAQQGDVQFGTERRGPDIEALAILGRASSLPKV